MNTSNQSQATTATEQTVNRLWHELTESRAQEGRLAEAGYNLVTALDYDFDQDLPRQSRRARDKLVGVLPRHLKDQLKRVYDIGEADDRMSKANKVVLVGTLTFMAGLLIWAYVHSFAA